MAGSTKYALEDALKKLLLQKPIDKITINDLTEECGISRMTFYYHFKDIYDLVEWVCIEDGKRALQDNTTPGRREWDRSSRLFWKTVRLS